MRSSTCFKAYLCVHACRCKVLVGVTWRVVSCVRKPVPTGCNVQAAGRAAVLLLPDQQLFVSVDVLYLLPLRDKVRSRALEPATMLCTPLTSVSTHSLAPLASHHLLTVVISCILLQVVGDHCGTLIIFVCTLILIGVCMRSCCWSVRILVHLDRADP